MHQEFPWKWSISRGLHSFAWVLLLSAGITPSALANPSAPSTSAPTSPSTLLAQALPEGSSPGLRLMITGRNISGVVTSRTPSPIRLSIPSLWWITKELANLQQFGNKFIQEWIAYPSQDGKPGRVDLLVNRQQWSLLDYIQRYEFVNKFGAIARSFGYDTRVYDNPDRAPIALYACSFSPRTVDVLQAAPRQPASRTETAIAVETRSTLSNQLNCDLEMVQPGRSLGQQPLVAP
ncbi:MAG: hypothetical protein IGS48_10670 [Oscillatoriales cyanobacterium C42_A2020_001]|nr:hypothetical protein [Leptolyngbyaceae cyanobacterium C42_A2020_001]